MSNAIKLHGYVIPSNEDLGVLLLNNKPFFTEYMKEMAPGLLEEVRATFLSLIEKRVQEFRIHATLQKGRVSDLEDLASISVALFKTPDGWQTEGFLGLAMSAEVRKTVGIIAYMNIPHFRTASTDAYFCNLCEIKHRHVLGFNAWKPCPSPQCIGHEAEHAINPNYPTPETEE